jgi:hypothetical protein
MSTKVELDSWDGPGEIHAGRLEYVLARGRPRIAVGHGAGHVYFIVDTAYEWFPASVGYHGVEWFLCLAPFRFWLCHRFPVLDTVVPVLSHTFGGLHDTFVGWYGVGTNEIDQRSNVK